MRRPPRKKHLPLALAVKLGSIAVHAKEMLSAEGHYFDKVGLETLLNDQEVTEWIKKQGALLPQTRGVAK